MRGGTMLEARADELMRARRLARAKTVKLEIVPYRGFGTPRKLMLSGRVLAQKRIFRATDRESVWRNLLDSYQRLNSTEIPGARLHARFGELSTELQTDKEGYFQLALSLAEPLSGADSWYSVLLELLEPLVPGSSVSTNGHVLVPPADAEFGVISDLDDTVIQTGATSFLRLLRTTLLHSARVRLPFEGVASFYQALQGGIRGGARNPIFYVSSSPWNLYDLLTEFLNLQNIPIGPLLLGDFGFDERKWIHASHDAHKHQQIQRIFETYPELPFILIGDSGQKDPEIYLEVIRTDPKRIKAVYIRDVTTPQRDAEVHAVAAKAAELGVETQLVSDTIEAVAHARNRGFIA